MRRVWLVLLILPPLLAFFVLPPFGQRLVTLVGIYALLGVGYQIIFGQLGAFNLAQGALFGVGAYATALAAPALGGLSFVVSVLASALAAALVAGPILRLQSHYFALATLALASLVNLVAVNAESLTGGANGLVGFAGDLPRGAILLGLVWAVLIVAVLAYAVLFRGALGEGARLLREAPLAAATLGIDGGVWRFTAFVVGGAFAGFAGACSATLAGVVSPETTGFPIMLICLTSVVLGGVRHPMGAVLGAAVAVGLPELFRDFAGGWLLAYAARR
jgi:branched-chain amino acid transport system permease protein